MDILQMPTEILLQIFSYLSVKDVVHLCDINSDLKEICLALKLKYFNFSCDYTFSLAKLNSPFLKSNSQLITTLNINAVYWIPAYNLRKHIGRMINLENLYVLDTTLSNKNADITLYEQLSKLRTIAFTIQDNNLRLTNKFLNMEKICVHITTTVKDFKFLREFLHSNVKEVQIIFLYNDHVYAAMESFMYKNYFKTFYSNIIKTQDLVGVNIKRLEECEAIVLDISINSKEDEKPKAYLAQCALNASNKKWCSTDDKDLLKDVVRVSVALCNFHALQNCIKDETKYSKIKILELSTCEYTCTYKEYHTAIYKSIGDFKQLEELIFDDIPLVVSGNFFKDVFQSFQCLKYINITLSGQNSILFSNFLLSVKYLSTLKDLRLDMVYVPFNKFLYEFPFMKTLERIYIEGKMFEIIDMSAFDKFMIENQHVIFMMFIIKDLTNKTVSQCKRIMMDAKGIDRRKIYITTNNKITSELHIPSVHLTGIVYRKSVTTNLDIFEEFKA